MDCVYHAYTDYMRYLGEQVGAADLLYWKTLKWWTHGSKPQYTFGGVAPWIVSKLAGLHGVTCATFYRLYTPAHFIEIASKHYHSHYYRMKSIIKHTRWTGVSKIVGYPGIYFLLTGQHATFSINVPEYGKPVMLIQMW